MPRALLGGLGVTCLVRLWKASGRGYQTKGRESIMRTKLEKELLAALLTLRAESVVAPTWHGSELHKAQKQADKVIRKATKGRAT
jgi:hypothetical protein